MTIIKADPQFKKLFLFFLLEMVLVVLGFQYWGLPRLQEFLKNQDLPEMILTLQLILFTAALPLLVGALWIGKMAWMTLKTHQFPPPGTKVLRDTVVKEGVAAHRQAYLLMLAAGLVLFSFVAAGVWIPLQLGELILSLFQTPLSGS
jgi:hypothetical protein